MTNPLQEVIDYFNSGHTLLLEGVPISSLEEYKRMYNINDDGGIGNKDAATGGEVSVNSSSEETLEPKSVGVNPPLEVKVPNEPLKLP